MSNEIRVKNLSKTEAAEVKHILEEYKAKHNIRFNKQAYLELIKKGSNSNKSTEISELILILQEINNRLKVIEPEVRVLLFGIFAGKPEKLKKLNDLDISKIPILDSITKLLAKE